MYSTIGIGKNSKKSGKIIGTHQKLDRVARQLFQKNAPKKISFPTIDEILVFEGVRGPDGLKWKSPGVDEPMHFIQPEKDDGKLWGLISDHQYNLRKALSDQNMERAAFEAAWMAHAITDGLTPAHQFPYQEAIKELMSDKEFVKIFGKPIKGIMRGNNVAETARNNWLYWGAGGYMTKHVAFEYGVALVARSIRAKNMMPKDRKIDIKNLDLKEEFYRSVQKIADLNMYTRFQRYGWTVDLAFETRHILLPEIVRAITIGWLASIPKDDTTSESKKRIKKSKADTSKIGKTKEKSKKSKQKKTGREL